MLVISLVTLSLAATGFAGDRSINGIMDALKKTSAIPDVVSSDFQPKFPIELAWGDAFRPLVVDHGATVSEDRAHAVPGLAALTTSDAELSGKPFTLIIVDPDYPSPDDKSKGQYLNYIGKDFYSLKASESGPDFFILANRTGPAVDYKWPTVPKGGKAHRVIAALYQQSKAGLLDTQGFTKNIREHFNLADFAKKAAGLTMVSATVFYVGPPADPVVQPTAGIGGLDTLGPGKSEASKVPSPATAATIVAGIVLAILVVI